MSIFRRSMIQYNFCQFINKCDLPHNTDFSHTALTNEKYLNTNIQIRIEIVPIMTMCDEINDLLVI